MTAMGPADEPGRLIPMAEAALARPAPHPFGPTPWKILHAAVLAWAGYQCQDCGAARALTVVPTGANPHPHPPDYRAICAAGCPA
jgi:hypothetical protein